MATCKLSYAIPRMGPLCALQYLGGWLELGKITGFADPRVLPRVSGGCGCGLEISTCGKPSPTARVCFRPRGFFFSLPGECGPSFFGPICPDSVLDRPHCRHLRVTERQLLHCKSPHRIRSNFSLLISINELCPNQQESQSTLSRRGDAVNALIGRRLPERLSNVLPPLAHPLPRSAQPGPASRRAAHVYLTHEQL